MLKTDAVFDSNVVKDGIILNAVGDCGDQTKGVLMELEDLAEGLLRDVKMFPSLDFCIKNTDLLLLLDDNDKREDETRIQVGMSYWSAGDRHAGLRVKMTHASDPVTTLL